MIVLSSPISLLDLGSLITEEERQQLFYTDHLSDLDAGPYRTAKPVFPSPEHEQPAKANVAFYLL